MKIQLGLNGIVRLGLTLALAPLVGCGGGGGAAKWDPTPVGGATAPAGQELLDWVPPAAAVCRDGWKVTTIPRRVVAGSASWAWGGDDQWHVAFLGANDPAGTSKQPRYVAEGAPDDIETLPALGALAIDRDETPNLFSAEVNVRRFRRGAGGWIADAAPVTTSDLAPALARIDGAGHAHLLVGGDYASDVSGSWTRTPIEPPELENGVFVVDRSSHAHVWQNGVDAQMWHTNTRGDWNDFAGHGDLHAFDLDSQLVPHTIVSSGRYSEEHWFDGAQWASQHVPIESYLVQAMKIDAQDHLHVLFDSSRGVQYASDASGAWKGEYLSLPVDVSGAYLAVDRAGQPHLALEGSFTAEASLAIATRCL